MNEIGEEYNNKRNKLIRERPQTTFEFCVKDLKDQITINEPAEQL